MATKPRPKYPKDLTVEKHCGGYQQKKFTPLFTVRRYHNKIGRE